MAEMADLSPRFIIINNTDSLIKYKPAKAWTDVSSSDTAFQTGSLGSPFSSSLKTTFQDGNFSFSFNGSSIQAFGPSDIISGPQPTLNCTIDGMVITPKVTDFPQNNWMFCSSGNLDVGQHELVVNVQSQGSLFFFDYVTFIPASDDQLNDALIRIDPSDSSISYSGNWTSEAMTDPAQLTNDNGSFVTLSFTGQQLTWYGSFSTLFPFAPAAAEFSVDGGPPTLFELAGLVDNGQFTAPLVNQLLFQTGELSQGPHEVTVTYLGTGQQTDLSLDYAIIQNSSGTVVKSTSSPTVLSSFTGSFGASKKPLLPSPTLTPNISTPLSSQSSTSSPTTTIIPPLAPLSDSVTSTVIKPTPSNTTIPAQSHSSDVPIIGIGIVAGAILLLAIVALAAIVVYKRRRRKHAKPLANSSVKEETSENTTPTLPTILTFSDGGGNNTSSALLRRQQTMRTATSDSLDGYVTPITSPRTSEMSPSDSTDGLLLNMQRAHIASSSLQVPSLPTLLDPFVFDTESLSSIDTRRISDLSSALVHNSNPHSIRLIRQLPHLPLTADVNQMARGMNDVGTAGSSASQAERDSGIRLGKDQLFHYQGSSSFEGTPPIYTRI